MKSFVPRILLLILAMIILFTYCKKEDRVKLPTIETLSITNISDTSATGGGNITNNGGNNVIARGVCWSTSVKPTISDFKTIDGEGSGSFSSNITGLNGSTTYYVIAYATNSLGTGYGIALSFKTADQLSTSATQAATNVSPSSATLNGIVNPKNLTTAVTFEFGIDTSYGQVSTATQSPLKGSINKSVSANITGLNAATTYHFRVKTENTLGITYGNDMTFKTLGQLPTSSTQSATNVFSYSATLNGIVNANYLSTTVTFEYGVSTGYGYTVTAAQSPVSGSSTVSVSAGITGLLLTTTYHFRIITENALGITYGNDLSFKTAGQLPTSTTQAATIVTPNLATLNATVNANYLSTTITFEYGLSTSYGLTIPATQSPLTGSTPVNVSANITGLSQATTYHFRVKSENVLGITYGSDMSFKTLTPLTDIDGNNYKTVKIGTQEWMAENLKTTKYNDGTAIPLVTVVASWQLLTTPGYCWYNNDSVVNKATYGALYNWYTVNTSKQLCPTGWHVPTDAEWTILTTFLISESVAGGKLKETGTTHWLSPNTGATNESGFTALPGGYRTNIGAFNLIGNYGYWWSTTQYNADNAWFRNTYYNLNSVARTYLGKGYGFSVRCVK
jgi:uncharacterized protein (TIGR02145 family)